MTPEQEIKLLKELLYCTKRSCNNCGKVNCENFQRQRIDCCGLWVSYKDYITELENKIDDIKANCDLAIEGRDLKIDELERKLEQTEKDLADYLFNYPKIKELEKENAELKKKIGIYQKGMFDEIEKRDKKVIKATELFELFIQWSYGCCKEPDYKNLVKQAEQFLKEIEK